MAEMQQNQGLAGIRRTCSPFSDDDGYVNRVDKDQAVCPGEHQRRGAERRIPAPNAFGMGSGRYGVRMDLLDHRPDLLNKKAAS